MLKKKWVIFAVLVLLLAGAGVVMFVLNPPPRVPPVALNEPTAATRPFVVKLHAQWCAVCLLAKPAWAELQTAYAGRVNLVVFDITNKETTEASRAEAKRLGLAEFFEAHSREPGAVYLLDGISKEVKGSVSGARALTEFSVVIDEVLKQTRK
jgi:thiol-disulfide isomerase/thioredoxin